MSEALAPPEPHPVLREVREELRRTILAGDPLDPRTGRRLERILKLLPAMRQAFASDAAAEEAAMLRERRPAPWLVSAGQIGETGGAPLDAIIDEEVPGFGLPQRDQAPNPVETWQSRAMREALALGSGISANLARQTAVQAARVQVDALREERMAIEAKLPDIAASAAKLREDLAQADPAAPTPTDETHVSTQDGIVAEYRPLDAAPTPEVPT